MSSLKKLLDKNSPYLFFVKFLSCYFILYFFFPFYRGITSAGGKIYSSFLDDHFNLVRGFTSFLTGVSRLLLQLGKYNVHQKNYHSLQIEYSRGISVNPSCLGWAVMSFWVAFVFANNGTVKHKLKWMTGGIASIIILNITRITLIVLSGYHNWKTINSLDHHQTFNIFSYGCIFILMFWYIRVQKKYEGIDFKRKQIEHTVSAI